MTMKKIKLFDYQEDMVKRVQEAFKHHDAVMVQMPTGTGKTRVLANIVFSFLRRVIIRYGLLLIEENLLSK